MYPVDLDTSSIVYIYIPILRPVPCSSFIIALNAVIHSCAPAELTPLHPASGAEGQKSMRLRRRLGPSDGLWQESTSHPPTCLLQWEPRGLKQVLNVSFGSWRGGKETGKRKKVERKRKCIPCYLTSASGITVQKWRIIISKSSLKIKGNKKTKQTEECFPSLHSSYCLTRVAV